MPMMVTSVCSTCTKTNITVVSSGMVANKSFYPDGWNILYNSDNPSVTVSCICSKDCMQLHVNKINAEGTWVLPDGSNEKISPVRVH